MKLYSGADPIFDEKDIFRLTVSLNADYSPEKGLVTTLKTTRKTTRKGTTRKDATRKTTPKITLKATEKATLQGTALKIAQLMLSRPEIKIDTMQRQDGAIQFKEL